ncbi:hypothetical protein LCM20_07010 [Halobacillus litoralis]|uniref:YphA family membrane protein n=1 Tax=Halobacillus litoralis TaxID=45668 RepID=UPI001CD282B1|nr:hypothetical protein [Halobacillus litoralis]MCA0970333.1 hypothetical protein [Halobacillus litoralis]
MAPTFYWLAWLIVIIVTFFIEPIYMKKVFLLFMGLIMCLFSLNESPYLWAPFVTPAVFVVFGIKFWMFQKQKAWAHLWPFTLSIGFSAIQLFLIVIPLWRVVPVSFIGIGVYLFFVSLFVRVFFSSVGLWLIVSGLGTFWTCGVLYMYDMTAAIDPNQIVITVMKGLLLLFMIHGVLRLKNMLKHKSLGKGAVQV